MRKAVINGFAICGMEGRHGSDSTRIEISNARKLKTFNPPNPLGIGFEAPRRQEHCLSDSTYEKDSQRKRIQATLPGK